MEHVGYLRGLSVTSFVVGFGVAEQVLASWNQTEFPSCFQQKVGSLFVFQAGACLCDKNLIDRSSRVVPHFKTCIMFSDT